MKNISKLLALGAIFLMASFTNTVLAQSTLSSVSASAKIITPIALTNPTSSSLNFGSMSVLAGTGGTCVLSTTGTRSATGGVNISAIGPAATNAAFHVTGNLSTTYAIQLPPTITVTNGTPADDMTIVPVARTASAGVDGLTGTLSGTSGADDFTIGGTLTVAQGQTEGTYSGSFEVTVAYN